MEIRGYHPKKLFGRFFLGDYLATIIPQKKAYFWALQGDVPMKTAERE